VNKLKVEGLLKVGLHTCGGAIDGAVKDGRLVLTYKGETDMADFLASVEKRFREADDVFEKALKALREP
jgi:hypothetical protein